MGNKKTAVEWFMEQIGEKQPNGLYVIDTLEDVENVFTKAKEMEKEQIKDAYFIGGHDIKNNRYRGMHEYYEQTYQEVTNDTTNK
jgi:GTP-dependent phosphoenolpyruvate carboxykinase